MTFAVTCDAPNLGAGKTVASRVDAVTSNGSIARYSISVFNSVTLAKERHMLWTVFVILLILWLLGFSFHIAGGLIHLLLVIAVVVLVINLITGRRVA